MEIQVRVLLLIAGVLILSGVALDYWRRRKIERAMYEEDSTDRAINSYETMQDDEDTDDLEDDLPSEEDVLRYRNEQQFDSVFSSKVVTSPRENQTSQDSYQPAPFVIAISIISRDSHGFRGTDLIKALNNAHFYFGKNNIFHRYANEDGTGELLFSLVNMHEPGNFTLNLLHQQHVHGITMIMLPDKLLNPQLALDKLIRSAKQIAFVLNGEMLDHNREPLTVNTINTYAAKITSAKAS